MTWNSTFTKPGKPLAKRSAKRVSEDKEFAKVRAEVMERDRYACQFISELAFHLPHHSFPIPPRCSSDELDAHHIVSRARDKTLALDPDNLIVLCRRHHDWCHQHPLEAESIGLLHPAVPSPDPQEPVSTRSIP